MPYVDCIDCGKEFWQEPDEHWRIRCVGCWCRLQQTKPKRKAKPAGLKKLRSELASLQGENEQLHELVAELTSRLRFLLFAAHPDRNPGHVEQATDATRWLLDVKDLHQDMN